MIETAVDFLLDEDGEMAIADDDFVMVSGIEAVAQDLRLSLGFFQGEWFLDESIGVPWFQDILVKNPDLVVVRERLRRAILDVPHVIGIQSLTITVDGETRRATVEFSVITDLGEVSDSFSGPVA